MARRKITKLDVIIKILEIIERDTTPLSDDMPATSQAAIKAIIGSVEGDVYLNEEGVRNVSGDKINIGGNVTGSAVGSNASLKARDIVTQIQQSGALGQDLQQAFAKATEALEALKASEGTKEDVADDMEKLKKELEKPTKDEGRIKTIWERINAVAATVASALSAAATIGKIVTGTP